MKLILEIVVKFQFLNFSHNMYFTTLQEKNEDSKPERRPFDRDIDLQVYRFDEAQKKSIIQKAQLLNSRFSSGKSKYL